MVVKSGRYACRRLGICGISEVKRMDVSTINTIIICITSLIGIDTVMSGIKKITKTKDGDE